MTQAQLARVEAMAANEASFPEDARAALKALLRERAILRAVLDEIVRHRATRCSSCIEQARAALGETA